MSGSFGGFLFLFCMVGIGKTCLNLDLDKSKLIGHFKVFRTVYTISDVSRKKANIFVIPSSSFAPAQKKYITFAPGVRSQMYYY